MLLASCKCLLPCLGVRLEGVLDCRPWGVSEGPWCCSPAEGELKVQARG